jgi:NhaA family Na+:H+ antiporter
MNLTFAVFHPVTIGIILGLFVGKPLGVTIFSYFAVKTRLAALPEGVRWSHIAGAGMLGGIGFTMSLFIPGLSFSSPELLDYSKLGILIGSLLSAAVGLLLLGIDFMVNRQR